MNILGTGCFRCGRSTKLVWVHYNKNIGMGFRRQEQSIEGWFCPKCVRILFCQYFFTCLFLGWFGLISFVTNPFRILFDLFQYTKAEIRLGGLGRYVVYACIMIILVSSSVSIYHSLIGRYKPAPIAVKTYDEVVSQIYPMVSDISSKFSVEASDYTGITYFQSKLKGISIDGGVVEIGGGAKGNLDYCAAVNTTDRGIVFFTIAPTSIKMDDENQRLQCVYLKQGEKVGLLPAKFATSSDYSWYSSYLDSVYSYYDYGNYLSRFSNLLDTFKQASSGSSLFATQSEIDEANQLIDKYNNYVNDYNNQIKDYNSELDKYPETLLYVEKITTNPSWGVLPTILYPPTVPLPLSILNVGLMRSTIQDITNLNKDLCKVDRVTDKNFVVTKFSIEW